MENIIIRWMHLPLLFIFNAIIKLNETQLNLRIPGINEMVSNAENKWMKSKLDIKAVN